MSEVQPVLVTELVFVLVLRRMWIGQQVAAAWASALAVCLALAVFLIAAEPTGGRAVPQASRWLSAGLVFGGTIAALTALTGRRHKTSAPPNQPERNRARRTPPRPRS